MSKDSRENNIEMLRQMGFGLLIFIVGVVVGIILVAAL